MSNTYVTKLSACICLLLLVFYALACSEQNADAPNYDKVHPQTWSNPQFVNAEPFHGSQVVMQGTASCVKCHDIDGKGQRNIPGCFKCHFGPTGSQAPIGSGWLHGNNKRHEDFENQIDTCNQCHRLNRSYGNGPARCHDCHDD